MTVTALNVPCRAISDADMKKLLTAILIMLLAGAFCSEAGRPVSDRPRKTRKVAKQSVPSWQRSAIHLTLANNDTLCLHLDSVRFSGFDKPSSGDKESFLVTNRNRLSMAGLTVEITYLSPDGRLLHRRILTQQCFIPPFETRKLDVRSFDTQGAYHYINSSGGRNGAFPFTVVFRPITLFFHR